MTRLTNRNYWIKGMNLIGGYTVSPFNQIQYNSKAARDTWAPIIKDCSNLVQRLELLSVSSGQRQCSWRTVHDINSFRGDCENLGLTLMPLKNIKSWGNGFVHNTSEPKPGDPISTYCLIVKKGNEGIYGEYAEAYRKGDHKTQGYFLGFPDCCTNFFEFVWKKKFHDPIYQIVRNTHPYKNEKTPNGESTITAKFHSMSNPILRYIGLRVGFHIPCKLDCKKTVKISKDRLSLATGEDSETAKLLIALLSMPMSWSVSRGIATVKTPIFTMNVNSINSSRRFTVNLTGVDNSFFPGEGDVTESFPYCEGKK